MSGSSSTHQWVHKATRHPPQNPPLSTPYESTAILLQSLSSVPRTISVPQFRWRYHLFQANIEGNAAGTLIPFPNREAALQAARAMNRFASGADSEFLQAVEIIESTPTSAELLFPKVVVRWSEWLQILKQEKPSNAEKIALSVYKQLYMTVRRRFKNKDPSFLLLEDSFGIDQGNRVLFLAAPTGGGDFHGNILELRKMSTELASVLWTVKIPVRDRSVLKNIDAAINLLKAFNTFIRSVYLKWVARNLPQAITGETTRQWFALNHPVSYDLPETLRYFINLGRLGDRQQGKNLCNNPTFSKEMSNLIQYWRRSVAADHNLRKVLEYSVSQAQGGNQPNRRWRYRVEDIPLFASNGMKHYWQHTSVGEKKMTKAEVISYLEDFIPGLGCIMYVGYAKAVIEGGYNHDVFDAFFILSKDT